MLSGSLPKNILLFALPIAASNIIQALFNAADVAVAGSFAGSDALAAVGANAPIVSLFVTILTGLSIGANVYISRLIGAGEKQRASDSIHTAVAFSFLIGIFMMICALFFGKSLLLATGTPAKILHSSVLYLRIFSMGLPFLMFYNFGAAILRSVGDTRRPMVVLILSGILNVVLNLFLVTVFKMGVSGVATATFVSTIVNAVFIFRILAKEEDAIRVVPKKLKIHSRHLKEILRIGTPAAVQSCVFSISNIVVQSGINSFGADAIGGSSAALNYEYFAFYTVQAFGQAVVTFVSHNYGAKNLKRCRSVLRIGMLEGISLTALICIVFFIFKGSILLVYTTNPAVLEFGMKRLVYVALLEFLVGMYDMPGAAIRGLGNSLLPAVITIIGTVVFRIFWINVVFANYNSFRMLITLYPVSWILTASMMIPAYFITRRKVERSFYGI